MDFRFPEFSAPREPNPESVSRNRDRTESGFADYLDSSLRDQQADEAREASVHEPAPRQAPAARDARDARPARPQADRNEQSSHDVGETSERPDAPAAAESPAPVEDASALPETDAPLADAAPAARAADAAEVVVPGPVQAAAAPVTPIAPAPTAAKAASPAAAPAPAPGPAPANDAGMPAAAPTVPSSQGKEAAEAGAQPQKTGATKPAGFTSELAAAAAKAPEAPAAPSRPQAGAKTQPATTQTAAANTAISPDTITAPVAAANAPSGNNGRESADAGNRSLNPQQNPPQASQTVTASGSEDPDAGQIAALVRHAANAAASSRPADTAPATPVPSELAIAETSLDIAPPAITAEPAKPENPSRPFGNVAPGLSVAAQITAQQTPDQANAAERIAQLVSARDANAAETAGIAGNDAAPASDEAAVPVRFEQAPQLEATSPRTISVDAASAAAAARNARPAFHPVVAQVAMHVAQAAADGNDRINIRLSPAELGRIDVRLDFGPDGRVQAVFAADRPQTVELLQRDARDLERALQDAGLRADSGSLSFNLRGEGRNGTPSFAETAENGRRDDANVEIAAPQVQAYTAGSAAPGRLDIRI